MEPKSKRETITEIANLFCDGDTIKAQLLLNLITSTYDICSEDKEYKEAILELTENLDCLWKRGTKCWVDMPDSIHTCKGKCERFEELK